MIAVHITHVVGGGPVSHGHNEVTGLGEVGGGGDAADSGHGLAAVVQYGNLYESRKPVSYNQYQ